MLFSLSLLWNPINVIEGEGEWIFFCLSLLLFCWLATKIIDFFVSRISKRLPHSQLSFTLQALSKPMTVLFWFLAFLLSIDKVTEKWLSADQSLFCSLMKGASALAFGWFLFRYKSLFVIHTIEKHKKEDPQIAEVLLAASKMGSVFIVILVLFLLHDITGISMTTVLAFGGVGGLALAFASQEIVQNFFGGFMLHMTRPFFHGEIIVVPQNNIEGTVESIGWYQTLVRSTNREAMYIPNSVFTRACVVNKTRIKGRMWETSFFLEVPHVFALSSFCTSFEERIRTTKQIDYNERVSVWIMTLYGKKAQIALSCVTVPMTLENFHKIQTALFIVAQEEAERYGGTLSLPPVTYVADS